MLKFIRQLLNGKDQSAEQGRDCDVTSREEREQIVARSLIIQQKLKEQLGKTTT